MNIYLSKDGQQTGPFPLDEVKRKLAVGEVQPTQLAWYQGAPAWGPLSAVPGVGPLLPTAVSAAPGGSPSGAPAGMGAPARLPGLGSLPSSAALQAGGRGFFGSLFDFSFTSFVTPKIIKVLFILGLLFVSIYAIFTLILGLISMGQGRIGAGLGMLILTPIAFVLGLCYVRVLLELMVAIFRIAENTSLLAQNTTALLQHQVAREAEKKQSSSAAAGSSTPSGALVGAS